MGYNSLPEEGIEALTEHALGNYLPINGGFRQHYQIRNFGRRKKPKGKTRFYAVEYVPFGINLEKSPIYLNNEKKFNEFNEKKDYTFFPKDEGDDELGIDFMKEWNETVDYYDKIHFYGWGIKRGFEFYGWKRTPNFNAKSYDDYYEKLEELQKKDPLVYNTLAFDYPTQSFFKIGLTNTTAEKRGYLAFDKEDKKKYPNPYKTIYIEKDLTDLSKKIHPADVEVFIYFHLFYKYWKDKLFYFSPNKINLVDPIPSHQQLKFFGYTESFLFENVEDKLKIINDAFELLESLTKGKINTMLQNMINYNRIWNSTCLRKNFFISPYDFDNWCLDEVEPSIFQRSKFGDGYTFLTKIGFFDKWFPENNSQMKDLFDKKAEEFILPNTKHYPEIPNLKTL